MTVDRSRAIQSRSRLHTANDAFWPSLAVIARAYSARASVQSASEDINIETVVCYGGSCANFRMMARGACACARVSASRRLRGAREQRLDKSVLCRVKEEGNKTHKRHKTPFVFATVGCTTLLAPLGRDGRKELKVPRQVCVGGGCSWWRDRGSRNQLELDKETLSASRRRRPHRHSLLLDAHDGHPGPLAAVHAAVHAQQREQNKGDVHSPGPARPRSTHYQF